MVVLKFTPDDRVLRLDIKINDFPSAIGGEYKVAIVDDSAFGCYAVLYNDTLSGRGFNRLATLMNNRFNIFGNALICEVDYKGVEEGPIFKDVSEDFVRGMTSAILILHKPTMVDLTLNRRIRNDTV